MQSASTTVHGISKPAPDLNSLASTRHLTRRNVANTFLGIAIPPNLPSIEKRNLNDLNQNAQSLFKSGFIDPLPSELVQIEKNDKYKVHYNRDTAKLIVDRLVSISRSFKLIAQSSTTSAPVQFPIDIDMHAAQTHNKLLFLRSQPNYKVNKCTNYTCTTCHFISPSSTFNSHYNATRFTIMSNIHCKSANVVYLISCLRCKMQYVGETGRSLCERFAQHKFAVTSHLATPIGIHFNSSNHSLNDLSILPIELCNSADVNTRRQREQYWQQTLGTIYPTGLNCMPTDCDRPIHPTHPKPTAQMITATNRSINDIALSRATPINVRPPRRRVKFIGRKPFERRKYNAIKASKEADMIFNLSTAKLSHTEINLLNRGLNFCPSSKPKMQDIETGLDEFERRLQLVYHFYVAQSYSNPKPDYGFTDNIVKTNQVGNLNKEVIKSINLLIP